MQRKSRLAMPVLGALLMVAGCHSKDVAPGPQPLGPVGPALKPVGPLQDNVRIIHIAGTSPVPPGSAAPVSNFAVHHVVAANDIIIWKSKAVQKPPFYVLFDLTKLSSGPCAVADYYNGQTGVLKSTETSPYQAMCHVLPNLSSDPVPYEILLSLPVSSAQHVVTPCGGCYLDPEVP